MRGPSHVLSPTGEWVDFEYLDPAAVDAVKALLDANICSDAATESGYHQAQTENASGPGDASTSRGPANTCVGGASDG